VGGVGRFSSPGCSQKAKNGLFSRRLRGTPGMSMPEKWRRWRGIESIALVPLPPRFEGRVKREAWPEMAAALKQAVVIASNALPPQQ
jgi:hypothetical protein